MRTPSSKAIAAASEGVLTHIGIDHRLSTHDIEPLAEIIDRHEFIDRFEARGDAIIRWVCTLTFTLCGAAALAAYVAQYLAGK